MDTRCRCGRRCRSARAALIILGNQIEDMLERWDWRDLLAGIDHVTSSGRRAVVSDAR